MSSSEALLSALLSEPSRALWELDRLDAEAHLRDFIPMVWDIIEPGRRFVPGWCVDALCEHLEAVSLGQIRRLVINVPPGFMKSLTTAVLWPAWEWGPQNKPHMRYIDASYSESLTVRDNRRMRSIMLSDGYQERWGDRFKLLAEQNAKIRFDNDRTGWKIATSVAGLGTGERGDRFIIDDPHNVKETESDAKREAALQWFSEVVPTRMNDEKSAIIVIMQRVHDRDVSGLILKKELNYEWLCLPMKYEKAYRTFTSVPSKHRAPERVTKLLRESEPLPRWVTEGELAEEAQRAPLPEDYEPRWQLLYPHDLRSEEDELLWPERFPEDYLENEIIPALSSWGGDFAVAGQLQQRPAPRGGGMFKRENLQIISQLPDCPIRWVRGYDLASSKDPHSAFTAGVKLGKTSQGQLIIGHVRKLQGSPGQVENMVREVAEADGVGMEIHMPQDPGQAGKSQKMYLARQLHGFVVRFSPESGSKEDRARPLAAQSEAGNLFLLRGPWNDSFISEAIMFPNGTNTDQVDAASRADMGLRGRRTLELPAPPVLVGAS